MDTPPVAPHVVLSDGDEGRVILELVVPWIDRIAVQRVSVAIDLPDTRYGHRAPALVVEAEAPEVPRALIGMAHPVEAP